MDSGEIKKEMAMTYDELVNHLLHKYGKAKYDYFCNETCESYNKKVSRTREGLYCHHIDEDKEIMLSESLIAKSRPYKYQKADRLVYCNILEHVMLHIKIMECPHIEAKRQFGTDGVPVVGVGGVYLMCPRINDYFNGSPIEEKWRIPGFSLIENNFEDYIEILKYFLPLANTYSYNALKSREKKRKEEISKGIDKEAAKILFANESSNYKLENKEKISQDPDEEIVKKVKYMIDYKKLPS